MSEWHSVPSTRAESIPPNDLDKQGAFTSIVREPTQNSTDNCLDETQPVKIKFSLKLVDAAPIKASYLPQSWLDHVTTSPFYTGNTDRARQANGAVEQWLADEQIPVLLIEDYNTTGLVGDITLYQHNPQETPEEEENNTFYWLLRTLGMSAPTTGRGGSWGLGKLAFPLASRLKTFFAVTSRPDPEERFLLGQALLEYRADRFNDKCCIMQMVLITTQSTTGSPYPMLMKLIISAMHLELQETRQILGPRSSSHIHVTPKLTL
jgi:hypothetical protein